MNPIDEIKNDKPHKYYVGCSPTQDEFCGSDKRERLSTHTETPDKDAFDGTHKRERLSIHTRIPNKDAFDSTHKRERLSTHAGIPDRDAFDSVDKRELLSRHMDEPKRDKFKGKKRLKKLFKPNRIEKFIGNNRPTASVNQRIADGNAAEAEKSTSTSAKVAVMKNIPYWLSREVLKITEVKAEQRIRKLYIYDHVDGFYHASDELEFWTWMILHAEDYAEKLTTSIVRETYHRLLVTPGAQTTMDEMDPNQAFVNCRNCVVNVETGDVSEHSPKHLFINCLAGNYLGPDAPYPQKYINWISHLLQEKGLSWLLVTVIGYMLSNYHTAKKFFYLFGASNSGKSQILHLIEKLVGEHVASHIAIEDMSEKHTAGELYGKKINTCAELEPGKAIKKTRILKSLTGGDIIDANPKCCKHFQYLGKTKIMQSANPKPTIAPEADDEALRDRLLPIEFKTPIPEKKRIPYFIDSLLAQESDLIVTFHIGAMRDNVHNSIFHIPIPDQTKVLLAQLWRNNNSVRVFVETKCVFDPEAVVLKREIKERYLHFCAENNLPALSEIKFIKTLRDMYPQIQETRIHAHAGENALWGLRGIRFRDDG